MNAFGEHISVEYASRPPRRVKVNSNWFADDDCLIAVQLIGSELKLLAILGYGTDPVELTFRDVESWSAHPDLLAGIPIEIWNGKTRFRKLGGNLLHLQVAGEYEKEIVGGRVESKGSLLLELTYADVEERGCQHISVGEHWFKAPTPVSLGSKLLGLAIVLAFVALIVYLAMSKPG